MRVTFPRFPDHQPAYAVVERDDGVVYRLYGGRAGPGLPHDIRHLVTERALGMRDGIWGGIASGAVFGSMRHVSGRMPSQATTESRDTFRAQGQKAELVAGLADQVAGLDDPTPDQVRKMLPPQAASIDPGTVILAARELRVEAARWARLRVGQSLSYDWPAKIPRPRCPQG
jgi:hypothetical protein